MRLRACRACDSDCVLASSTGALPVVVTRLGGIWGSTSGAACASACASGPARARGGMARCKRAGAMGNLVVCLCFAEGRFPRPSGHVTAAAAHVSHVRLFADVRRQPSSTTGALFGLFHDWGALWTSTTAGRPPGRSESNTHRAVPQPTMPPANSPVRMPPSAQQPVCPRLT